MDKIFMNEVAWQNTFPNCVVPLPDEWLPGLLLRCDEANHWESGTTLAHLLRSLGKASFQRKSGWVIVPSPVLECLAQCLALSLGTLLVTTYHAELAHLYGTSHPHQAQLSRSELFRLCPACIAETRLMKRISVLPHLSVCPVHLVTFVSRCHCGKVLQLFSLQTRPFTCHACGLDWRHLPLIPASVERFKTEQKVLSCFEFFFAYGAPHMLVHALQRIREKLKREKIVQVRLLNGTIKQVEHYELTKASLGYLVDLLVSLDFAPSEAE